MQLQKCIRDYCNAQMESEISVYPKTAFYCFTCIVFYSCLSSTSYPFPTHVMSFLCLQYFCSDREFAGERRETGDPMCTDPRPNGARLSDCRPRNGLWLHCHPGGDCQTGLLPLLKLSGLTQHTDTWFSNL